MVESDDFDAERVVTFAREVGFVASDFDSVLLESFHSSFQEIVHHNMSHRSRLVNLPLVVKSLAYVFLDRTDY